MSISILEQDRVKPFSIRVDDCHVDNLAEFEDVNVNGNASINNLEIDGNLNVTNDLNVNNITVSGEAVLVGNSSINQLTSDTITALNGFETGDIVVNGGINANGSIQAQNLNMGNISADVVSSNSAVIQGTGIFDSVEIQTLPVFGSTFQELPFDLVSDISSAVVGSGTLRMQYEQLDNSYIKVHAYYDAIDIVTNGASVNYFFQFTGATPQSPPVTNVTTVTGFLDASVDTTKAISLTCVGSNWNMELITGGAGELETGDQVFGTSLTYVTQL